MRMERGHMQDVGLADVEVDGVATGSGAVDPAGTTPRRLTGRPRRLRIGLAAGVGVVLAVIAVVSVVVDRREASRLAALADVPGILAPLDGPVSETWHADAGFQGRPTIVDGSLVGPMGSSSGGSDLVALNPLTGATVWKTRLTAPDIAPESGRVLTVSTCLPTTVAKDAGSSGAVTPGVACLVQDFTLGTSGSTSGEVSGATHLMTVDAQTGEKFSDVAEPSTTTLADIGSDLVLASVGADGQLLVTRVSAQDGTPRWTFRGSVAVPGDDTSGPGVLPDDAGNRVLVHTSTAWWLLSREGDVERSGALGSGTEALGVPLYLTSRTLVSRSASSSTEAPQVDLLDLASGRSFTADGYPFTSTDDGSLSDLILLQSAHRLTAYDAASGAVRWAVAHEAGVTHTIIGGQVIVSDTTGLRVVDGRSGTTRWTTSAKLDYGNPILTDGTVVIAPSAIVDGTAVIAAFGLDDGRRLWTAEVKSGMTYSVVGGHLYADDGGSRVVAFR